MVRIGIVGLGYMGMIHYLAAQRLHGQAAVRAICTRDPKRRAGDWTGIRGNFGPHGTKVDLTGVHAHETLEQLLADPEVDLVVICLPSHLHMPVTLEALKAGKHVLVEKPIALNEKDADKMLHAAEATRRMLLVGHVLPFFPEFRFAYEFIRAGTGGKVKAAHFLRVISKPDWSADIADAAKSGGPVIDLHIHDTHFIRLLFGPPQQVQACGVHDGHTAHHLSTHYLYPQKGLCVTSTSGAICQKGRPFVHGFEIYLEKATLLFQSGTQPLTVLQADGSSVKPELKGGDDPINAFTAELATACAGVQTGQEPDLLSALYARDALALCKQEEKQVLQT
jgi:predicted dehydrogenase